MMRARVLALVPELLEVGDEAIHQLPGRRDGEPAHDDSIDEPPDCTARQSVVGDEEQPCAGAANAEAERPRDVRYPRRLRNHIEVDLIVEPAPAR